MMLIEILFYKLLLALCHASTNLALGSIPFITSDALARDLLLLNNLNIKYDLINEHFSLANLKHLLSPIFLIVLDYF